MMKTPWRGLSLVHLLLCFMCTVLVAGCADEASEPSGEGASAEVDVTEEGEATLDSEGRNP